MVEFGGIEKKCQISQIFRSMGKFEVEVIYDKKTNLFSNLLI